MKFYVTGRKLRGFTANEHDVAFILMDDEQCADILELDIGEKYVDIDGDTWERIE